MKIKYKFLCFFSLHKWIFTNGNETERKCTRCNRTEFLDIDNDVNPWGNPLWLKKSKTV